MRMRTGPLIAEEKLTDAGALAAVEVVERHMRALTAELVTKNLFQWAPVHQEVAIVRMDSKGGAHHVYAPSGAVEWTILAGLGAVGATREVRLGEEGDR